MLKRAAPLALAALLAAPSAAQAETFGLGREATEDEIAAWDIDVRPDGQGLPEGSGDVWTGEDVYVEQCASCHGDFGEGIDRWPILAGGWGSLESEDPVKTVGSYWPYLSTVWDYIHRAMPFGQAQSLSDDEVYAVTAYILYLNDLVDDDFTLSKETFAEVELPNEDGFFMDDREEAEPWMDASAEACMSDCKDEVEITYRARVLDVTPADAAAREAAEKAAEEGEETAAEGEETAAEGEEMAAAETEAEPAAEEEGPDPELVAAGERVWNKCRACHKVGEGAAHGVGPHLNDVVGREAGSLDDYRYSKAMETAGEDGLVWNEETMTEYLANPRKMIRGTKMTFAGLRDEADIDAVLAYIEAQQP